MTIPSLTRFLLRSRPECWSPKSTASACHPAALTNAHKSVPQTTHHTKIASTTCTQASKHTPTGLVLASLGRSTKHLARQREGTLQESRLRRNSTMQYEGQDEDEGRPMHHCDHSRFVPNLFPKDPPALSPVALLNPRETQTLEKRLADGWELVLRRTDPEHDHDFSIYTGSAGIGYLALHKVLLLEEADPRRPLFLEVARRYFGARKPSSSGACGMGVAKTLVSFWARQESMPPWPSCASCWASLEPPSKRAFNAYLTCRTFFCTSLSPLPTTTRSTSINRPTLSRFCTVQGGT